MSTRTTSSSTRSGPLDPVGADLVRTLKELKLGQMTQTLPERLVLARQQKMTHAAFLQLVLSDEITRRDSRSAMLRSRAAGLDPSMRLDTWDELDDLTYDRDLLAASRVAADETVARAAAAASEGATVTSLDAWRTRAAADSSDAGAAPATTNRIDRAA